MYWLLKYLLRPFPILLFLTGLGIVGLWVKKPESAKGLLLVAIPFCGLVLLCLPLVSYLALRTLERHHPPLGERPPSLQAIVVLSGAVWPADDVRPRPVLGDRTLHRCLHALRVYRQGPPCLIIASGGNARRDRSGPSDAEVMRDFFIENGVAEQHLLTEGRSRTTRENAVESAKLLAERGIEEIVLVTDAAHLYRATRCFRREGLRVVPSGCRYQATKLHVSLETILPSAGAARGAQEAWHEWLGVIWYRLRGWI